MLLAPITPLTLAKIEDVLITKLALQMGQIKLKFAQSDNLLIQLQTLANAQIHNHSLMEPLVFLATCQIFGTQQILHVNLVQLVLFIIFLHIAVPFVHSQLQMLLD